MLSRRATFGWLFVLSLILLLGFLPLSTGANTLATTPPEFTDELVASIGAPTDIGFTPDGRMLITTQGGRLRVVQNGQLLTTPALDLSARVCTNSERGLLGVVTDPNFAGNRFIYLYYTFKKNGVCTTNAADSPVNRVARFTLPDSSQIDPASEVVLVDNIHSPNGNHNAGDLAFGKDGTLYISTGDGGCDYADRTRCAGSNDAARDRHVLLGKILRITRDGSIPSDNPFRGADSARCNVTGSTDPGKICQETLAWGLRNPFRFAFDPNASGTRFFINDVGQNVWEEINEGRAGADYGWNAREGRCVTGSSTNCPPPPAGMTDPIFSYQDPSCNSITGGAFVPNGLWPGFDGAYLYSDYVCGKIFRLTPNGSGGYSSSDFVTGLGGSSAVALQFGPHNGAQALYYTTYASSGQVRRISYIGAANRAPVAQFTATPQSGPAPLTVSFDASASSDPDGDPITYEWIFGNGATGTGVRVSQTYAAGSYTAQLIVRDNRGGVSAPATVRIDAGNTPPQPRIIAPTADKRYAVGELITLTGSATDAQDGTLPDSALTWTVLLHHDTHTHPFVDPTSGNNLQFNTPAPEDLQATTNSYLEIQLSAKDVQGATTVITQELRPKLVDVTFNTAPAGLRVEVNGFALTGLQAVTSWENYVLNVNAPNQNDSQGTSHTFASWSDGGAQAHAITTPAAPASYTATFTAGTGSGTAFQEQNGMVVIEAENSDARVNRGGQAWNTRTDQPGYVGAGFVAAEPDQRKMYSTNYHTTAPELRYQVQFSRTGTYYVWVRAFAPDGGGDSLHVGLDGQAIASADRLDTNTYGAWVWFRSTLDNVDATLNIGAAGIRTLNVWFREDGLRLDRILLTSDAAFRPSGDGPEESPRGSGGGGGGGPFNAKVNFQPAGAPVPAGYLADTGAIYGDRGNGQSYGWNISTASVARDRNNTNAPDQRYDTLIHMQKPEAPNAVWEIGVPSGTYSVRIVCGDPNHYDSTYKVSAEGVLAVDGKPLSNSRWVEGTVTVTVNDGRLTVVSASGAVNNKIDFVEITGL